jgi:hypothetical protein
MLDREIPRSLIVMLSPLMQVLKVNNVSLLDVVNELNHILVNWLVQEGTWWRIREE